MNDTERQTLADIERRIVAEDPVLPLVAWRHVTEARRREAAASPPAPTRIATPLSSTALALAVAGAVVLVVGWAVGLWLAVVAAAVLAVAWRGSSGKRMTAVVHPRRRSEY